MSLVIYFVVLLVLNDCGTNIGMGTLADKGISESGSSDSQNLATVEPEFSMEDLPQNGGVRVTVTAPSNMLNEYRFILLRSRKPKRYLCVALNPENVTYASGNDSSLAVVSLDEHLALSDNYCPQLTCSCEFGTSCKPRPPRCTSRFSVGVNLSVWADLTRVSVTQLRDTDAGPAVSAEVLQHGFRFPKLIVCHANCADLREVCREIDADEQYLLHHDCTLPYDQDILLRVSPSTSYCNESSNCPVHSILIPGMGRQPPPPPASVQSAGPPLLLTAGVPAAVLLLLAAAGVGLLWHRRSQCKALKAPTSADATSCRQNAGFDHEMAVSVSPAAAPSVLLLHLARSDAERAAVRQLAAELSARGAAVTDSDSPQWRSAARMDATGLASAVPAHDRVLLLSSTAAAAGSGGGGERERLFAAAVRQLTGSGLTSNYGRVYQARLTTEAPTVAGLVTGAAYTLPEHQHELVAALLTGTNTTNGNTTAIRTGTSIDFQTDTNSGTVATSDTNSASNPDTNPGTNRHTNSDASSDTNIIPSANPAPTPTGQP